MIRKKEIQTLQIEQQNKINQPLPNNKVFKGIKFNSSSTHCFTIANKKTVRNYSCSSDYERQQQNCRIIKRIINPKRDKTIMRSFEAVKKWKMENSRAKTEHRNRSSFLKSRANKENSQQRQRLTHNNMQTQQYNIKLENERMGRRIINTKPKVSSIAAERILFGKMNSNSKINKGVFVFFNEDIHINRNDQQVEPTKELQLKQYYGYGPTILCISSISIFTNPMLKDEDLVFLELVVNSKSTNKAHQTHIVSYEILKSTKIKFAFSLSKIGQFVPLRLWKVHGVNNIQIGIVDIQFSKYIEQESKIKSISSPFQLQAPSIEHSRMSETNIQRNKQGKIRVLGKQKIFTKLRKNKIDEIEGTASIQYMIYRKKYF